MLGPILIRLVVCILILWLPFVLWFSSSKSGDAAIVFIFPFIASIPAIISLLIFVPVEWLVGLAQTVWLKNAALPLVGSLIGLLIFLNWPGSNPAKVFAAFQSGDAAVIKALAASAGLGGIWGSVWRLSEYILKWTGFANV